MVPRTLGTALHGQHANDVLHCDFLFMRTGCDELHYVLILKDDLSSYVWLWAARAATCKVMEEAMTKWISCFGAPNWLVSDQGSDFKNELLRLMHGWKVSLAHLECIPREDLTY